MQGYEKYIDNLTKTFSTILKGEKPELIELPPDFPDNEIKQLTSYFNKFIIQFNDFSDFTFKLSQGDLNVEPPVGKSRIHQSIKSIQSDLNHLTWKTQKIAKGDYNQKINFMGDFSDAFNSLTEQLRESKTSLEKKIEERTNELVKFKLCIDRSFEAIFITDVEGYIVFINPAFEQMYGYSPVEAIGKTPRILKSGTLTEDVYSYFWETLLSKKPATGELVNKTKDGKLITVEGFNTSILDSNGDINGYVGIHRNISEQKKAEESLKLFRTLIDSSNDAFEIVDPATGRFLDINEAGCKALGYSREEFLQLSVFDIDPVVTPESFQAIVKELRKSGTITWEGIHKRKNGTSFPVEVNIRIVEIEKEYMVTVARDISQRKLNEESVLKLSRAVEQSPTSVMITDSKGIIEYINPKLTEITGYKKEEVLGKNPRIFSSGEKPKSDYKVLWENILSGKNWEGEFLNRKKSGELFWEYAHISPIINSIGEITHFVAIKEDITERKKMIEELILAKEKAEENENKLTTLIGNLPGLVYSSNSKWETVFINGSLNITGYGDEDFMTKRINWLDLIHEDDRQMVFEQGAILLKKKTSIIQEYRIVAKDNRVIHVSDHKTSVFSVDNKFVGVEGVVFNITEKNKQKEELVHAKEKAEESDRLKSAFLANMSHEIRTPMNGILGFTDLLLAPDLSSEQKESFIKIVHQSGQRLLNTVNDIVEISKIEAGLVQVKLTVTDINERVKELFQFFQPEAQKKGLQLNLEMLLPANKKNISTDQNKVDSILTNLIKNAIKYTDSGSICIGCHSEGSVVEYYIKDTGIGIPTHRQNAIFNRFEQADIEDTRVFEGSGLGLALVKSYVEMLGGKIWVVSEEGIGSTFYFTLPVNFSENKKAVVSNELPDNKEPIMAMPVTRGLKVLIAEDDEPSRNYISLIVKDFCAEIMEAGTGVDAVELCRNTKDLDFILMDIQMPGMNGYEATRRIREFNKEVVIIAQTAFALSGDREKAIEAGCDDYISKPINREELNILIQKHVTI